MATAQQKMTVGEKLEKALEFKDVGNTAYKEGNYKVAAKNYHKAILYLKGIDNDLHGTPAFLQTASVDPDHKKHIDAELEQKCIKTNISVYNNLCMCLLQQPDSKSERIKELAEIVIELDSENEKAWYRRGQACIRLKDFDRAKTSFMKVASISGGKNKDVTRLLAECETELGKSREKENKMYQAMFKSKV